VSDGTAPGEVELTVVTMTFDALAGNEAASDRLMSVLSKYVVVSRGDQGCRNIDLCASVTQPGRYLIVQKWESPAAQAAHFDSDHMVEMARSCEGLLERKPDIDLFEGISAHDLN
jgi:quinol monooxygenase YgiN